jgi:hypothetical protein
MRIAAAIALLALACSHPAPVADQDWLARAQQHIAEREYRASESERGLQAPNRAHGLRAYFFKDGLRLHDRTAPSRASC